MGLYDIDKDSVDRSSPRPNTHDQVLPGAVTAHGTSSINYVTDATVDGTGGTNTGTAGGGAPIQSGFKRFVGTCVLTVQNDGSSLTTATVSHSLPFVPLTEATLENANVTIATGTATGVTSPLPLSPALTIDPTNHVITHQVEIIAFANSSNVYVNMYNSTGSPQSLTVTVRLYQRLGT